MSQQEYTLLNKAQLDKIGNTMIYLSENIPDLSKTKLLKLLYILDEVSIKKSGIPFLNLSYKVWRLGPVAENLFIDLSSRIVLFGDYVEKRTVENKTYINAKAQFVDDEFSDNDLELMDFVIAEFGTKTAAELIDYTHRKLSPWYLAAQKNGVLTILEKNKTNSTDYIIDMSVLVAHDKRKKEIYADYREFY